MGGERQEAGLLFGPDVGDGTVRLVGVASAVGDVVAPASELGVEVVEVAEGAGGEEGVPEVLDLAFDFPLLQSCRLLPVLLKHHRFLSPIRSIRYGVPASRSW